MPGGVGGEGPGSPVLPYPDQGSWRSRVLVRERNLHLKDDVITTEVDAEVRTLLVPGLQG